jgi:hypothetical protein
MTPFRIDRLKHCEHGPYSEALVVFVAAVGRWLSNKRGAYTNHNTRKGGLDCTCLYLRAVAAVMTTPPTERLGRLLRHRIRRSRKAAYV